MILIADSSALVALSICQSLIGYRTMNETDHIFERLRSGTVPEKGLDKFAVGIDKPLNEIKRQLNLASTNEGVFKSITVPDNFPLIP